MVLERLLIQNFIAAPAPVFRKDAWLACGGLDGTLWYTADWDMWLKLCVLAPIRYHDEVTIGFRIHRESLTVMGARAAEEFSEQMNIVLDRHLGRLRDAPRGLERAARASIQINSALARASAGNAGALIRAAAAVIHLGPVGLHRYFRDSRIVERVMSRLRATVTGVF